MAEGMAGGCRTMGSKSVKESKSHAYAYYRDGVTLFIRGETPFALYKKIWADQLSCLGGSVGRASA